MSFVGFQCILHDSAILFSVSQSSLKLKREAKILEGGDNSVKWLNYLVPSSIF